MQLPRRIRVCPLTFVAAAVALAACAPSQAGGEQATRPAPPEAPRAKDAPPDAARPQPFRLPTTSHTISAIQGRGHRSPLDGQTVTDVPGIVTHTSATSFVMQCSTGDGDPATSDALQVYVGRRFSPMPAVGDRVAVSGRVTEWPGVGYDGERREGVVTQTQIERPTAVRILESGLPLPDPLRIGSAGRMPPLERVAAADAAAYDVTRHAQDFWESLESMRVEVREAVVVGPSVYGEFTVIPDRGQGYPLRTPRGGVILDSERDRTNPGLVAVTGPHARAVAGATVGDAVARVVGVIAHDRFRAYKLLATAPVEGHAAGGLERVPTALGGDDDHLTIGSFNVENFSVVQGRRRAHQLARGIVELMRSPDIVGLQEVMDDDGAGEEGTTDLVDASRTYAILCEAIVELGGPRYRFVDVPPLAHTEGGVPGGNIRVGFLYDPERVSFEPRGDAGARTPNRVERVGAAEGSGARARLALNPGRVAPDHPAFEGTRRTLAAEFTFRGHPVVVLNSHLKSRRDDDPLFGPTQPAVLHSEPRRIAQARALGRFVRELTAADRELTVVALGDYNDFYFKPALAAVAGDDMAILTALLPRQERYGYIFQGNAQALDHVLIAGPLRRDLDRVEVDHVHVCAEFPAGDRISDHDPIVARLQMP